MASNFTVYTTPRFNLLAEDLAKQHQEFARAYELCIEILEIDPTNRNHDRDIKKLEDADAGDGQYRLRIGRFRFRHDVPEEKVVLSWCGLRRENTYRD